MNQLHLDIASREILTLVTPEYRPPPSYVTGLGWLPGLPPFTMAVVDAMRRDYQVKLAMSMKIVPVMKPRFSITGDPEVVDFIKGELRSIWTGCITDITEALWYTRFGCEMVYKRTEDGLVRFSRMMPYHPRDFRILTKDGEITGLRIIGSSGNATNWYDSHGLGPDNMGGDNARRVMFAPKCFTYVHDRKFGGFEGMSELEGAYPSWMEKIREGGAVASRSLWGYKCMYDSGMIVHPEGYWTDPNNPSIQIPYRDLALKIGESIRNGAVVAVPSATDGQGNRLWDWIRPEVNGGGEELMKLIDHLDGKINKGCGIPDDVIEQVSGTGSYAGRTIPFIAFLEAGTPTVRNICRELCRQSLTPLAQINFGESRGKDWEITEAAVNTDQFLGDSKAGVGARGGSPQIPGDGDGDGIPNEAQQMSLATIDQTANRLGLTGDERRTFFQGAIGALGMTNQASAVTFLADRPRRVLRAKGLQLGQSNPEEHEYSSTQFDIADGIYSRSQGSPLSELRAMAKSIAESDLAEDGRESEFHVTVKYGLHTNSPRHVAQAVADFGPVEITFGKTSVFKAGPDGEHDVVKIDIDSPDLHRLNALIRDSVECTDTFPDYKPHVTLAYVKPGKGSKYAGDDSVEGITLTFDELLFSNKRREKTPIVLLDEQAQLAQRSFAFNEDDHPRGQPDNKGQFTSKPVGGIADEPFSLKREKEKTFVPKNQSSQKQSLFDQNKLTHSPADEGIKKQAESLPGQKTIEQNEPREPHGPHHVTKTPQFKAWFGDWESDPANASKVVNAEGEPQETTPISGTGSKVVKHGKPVTVYHGTGRGGFESFDKGFFGNATGGGASESLLYGPGFYFTEDKSIADEYSSISKAEMSVVPVEESDEVRDKLIAAIEKATTRMEQTRRELFGHLPPEEFSQFREDTDEMRKVIADLKRGRSIERSIRFVAKGDAMNLSPLEKMGVNTRGLLKVKSSREVKEVFLNIKKPFDIDSGRFNTADLPRDVLQQYSQKRKDNAATARKNQIRYGEMADAQRKRNAATKDELKKAGVPVEILKDPDTYQIGVGQEGSAVRNAWDSLSEDHQDAWTDYVSKVRQAEYFQNMSNHHRMMFDEATSKDTGLTYGSMEGILRSKTAVNQALQDAGYDGLTHIGGSIMGGGHSHRVWIAFEPTQIKSVQNQGTFDPANPNINMSQDWLDLGQLAFQFDESKHPRDEDGKFTEKEHSQYEEYQTAVSKVGLTPRPKDEWVAHHRAVQQRQQVAQQTASPAKEAPVTPAPTPPAVPRAEHAASLPGMPHSGRIEDFGNKIGGARKDTARPTGPRAPKANQDERPAWQRRYSIGQIVKSRTPGEEGKWAIHDEKDTNGWGQARQKGGLFDTREEAEAALPLIAVARNHRVRNIGTKEQPNYAIYRDVDKGKYPVIKDGFPSDDEAMKYLAQHAAEIIQHKTIVDDRIHPAISKVQRVGADYRSGKNASPEDFQQFGFYGVEFGKWNNSDERQHILNHAYDSFRELADILNIPPNAISLDGQLGIGFGSRGKGGKQSARAHYEPDYGAINLTKLSGAGSTAHEWMHALDHYLGRISGKATRHRTDGRFSGNSFDEVAVSHGHGYKQADGYRDELKSAVDHVMDAIMRRKITVPVNRERHERDHERATSDLTQRLQSFRNELATDHTGDKYKRGHAKHHKPATPEQLAEVDKLIEQIRSGNGGEQLYLPSKGLAGPRVPQALARLNEIHQAVRGRNAWHKTSGYTSGPLVDLNHAYDARAHSDKMLKEAQENKQQERTVRTNFADQARLMDQGSKKDYWSAPHELLARAFDSYIYDKIEASGMGHRNDFLSYKKRNEFYREHKPFPEGDERTAIHAAFDKLFSTIKAQDLHSEPGEMSGRPKGHTNLTSDADNSGVTDTEDESDDE